jgi:hypothetical protein
MHCYRHQQRDAVGVCRNCGKAVCPLCCMDTGPAVACSADCVEQERQARQLHMRLRQSLGIGTNLGVRPAVMAYILFGLILLGIGAYVSFSRPGIDYLTLGMSAAFFGMAAINYRRHRGICSTC